MAKFAGLVEYDGTDFAGWAVQPGLRTIEETLASALGTVLRQPVRLTVAGRTDAGVHASGQVISFGAETDLVPASISYKATAILPKDLALRRCVAIEEDFDARRDAKSRSYEYRIFYDPIRSPLERLRAIHVARHLDLGLLDKAASLIRGEHDFRAFTPAKSHHKRFVRTVKKSSWEVRDGLLVYRITANSFLYGMVRSLVGTMLEVASGRRELSDLVRLLEGAERSEAGPAAPARGLTLVSVDYDNLDFRRHSVNDDTRGLLIRIDSYVEGLFAPPDPALEGALRRSRKAGLPEIQVSPAEGTLLRLLAEIAGARRILEIGTLGGYSTIHLARALPEDGLLISLEVDERNARVARENVAEAGLGEMVKVRVGDAKELLARMVEQGEGPYDLTFIDADKGGYPEYLEWALRLSRPGSLILGDNAIMGGSVMAPEEESARGIREFNKRLAQDPRLSAIVLPLIRERVDGLAIARVRA